MFLVFFLVLFFSNSVVGKHQNAFFQIVDTFFKADPLVVGFENGTRLVSKATFEVVKWRQSELDLNLAKELQDELDLAEIYIKDFDERKNHNNFSDIVLAPFSRLIDLAVVFLKPNDKSLVRFDNVCLEYPPQVILKDLKSLIFQHESLFEISDLFHHNAGTVESIEKLSFLIFKQLVIVDSICAAFQEKNPNVEGFLKDFRIIKSAMENQKQKIKEVYFPKSVEYVAENFLDHKSSDSYSYFSKEIKDYNEEIAKELAEYLNTFYKNFAVFSIGLNRDGKKLVGKLPGNVVVELEKNGWTGFVYRSPADATSFSPKSFVNVPTILETYQDSPTDNALCDPDPNKTTSEVFKAVGSQCESAGFCAVLPYSNFGLANYGGEDGSLEIEKYSLCDQLSFSGFYLIAARTPAAFKDRFFEELGIDWPDFERKFQNFVKEKSENVVSEDSDVVESMPTKMTEVPIVLPVKQAPIHQLNYTKDMEQIPLSIPKPKLDDANVQVTISSLESVDYGFDDRLSSKAAVFCSGFHLIFMFLVLFFVWF